MSTSEQPQFGQREFALRPQRGPRAPAALAREENLRRVRRRQQLVSRCVADRSWDHHCGARACTAGPGTSSDSLRLDANRRTCSTHRHEWSCTDSFRAGGGFERLASRRERFGDDHRASRHCAHD